MKLTDGLNSRLELTSEKISEPERRSLEIMHLKNIEANNEENEQTIKCVRN